MHTNKSNGSPKKKPQMSKCVRETDANLGLGAVSLVNKRLTSLEGLGVQNGLVKLYLQNNCLESFEFLSTQPHLKELYVQNNMIKNFKGLEAQPKLEIFGIAGNPICEKPLYRVMALLAIGPNLRRIDEEMITQVERMTASRLNSKAVQATRLGAIIDYKRRTDEDFDELIDCLSGKTPTKLHQHSPSSSPSHLPTSSPSLPSSSPSFPSSSPGGGQKVEIVYKSYPPVRRPTSEENEQEELILRALREIENADLDDDDDEMPEPDEPPTPEEPPELPHPRSFLSLPSELSSTLPHSLSQSQPPLPPSSYSSSHPSPPSQSSPRSQPPPRTPPSLPPSASLSNPSPRTPPSLPPSAPLSNPSPRTPPSLPPSAPLSNPSPRTPPSLPLVPPPLPALPIQQPHVHQHMQINQNNPYMHENGKEEGKPEKLTTRTDWEMEKLKEKIKQLEKSLMEEKIAKRDLHNALVQETATRMEIEEQLNEEKEKSNNLAHHLSDLTERCEALNESNEILQQEKLEVVAISAERLIAEREQRKLIEEKFEKNSPTKGANGRKTGETEFVSVKDMCQIDTIQFYTVIRKEQQNIAACISFHDDGISLMNTETSQAMEFPLKSAIKLVKDSDTLMTIFGNNNNVILNDKRIDLIANLINYWIAHKN